MANEMSKALLDGALGGVLLGGGYMGTKYLISRYLENKRLDKLKETVAKELKKQDVRLQGNIFKDVYSNKEAALQKKAYDYKNLPLWAAMLTSGALAAGGTVYGLQGLMNDQDTETPAFADNYKKQQKRKFIRAAKLLRAVTDDATMRDINKSASFTKKAEDAGVVAPVLVGTGRFGKSLADLGYWVAKSFGGGLREEAGKAIKTLSDAANRDVLPILATAGIVGVGGLGLYGLKKLLKRQAAGKKLITSQDDAINAWLAQRKESGDAQRTINAFVTRNDSAERSQLNNILKRYEEKYAPKSLNELQV